MSYKLLEIGLRTFPLLAFLLVICEAEQCSEQCKSSIEELTVRITQQEETIQNQNNRIDELETFVAEYRKDQEDMRLRSENRQKYLAERQNENSTSGNWPAIKEHYNGSDSYFERSDFACLYADVHLNCSGVNGIIDVTYAQYGYYDYPCNESCCYPYYGDCTDSVEYVDPQTWYSLLYRCDNQTSCSFEYQGGVVSHCEGLFADYMEVYYDCKTEPVYEGRIAFHAYASTGRTSYAYGEIVRFETVNTNLGEFYDPVASTFVCPYHGIYLFTVNIQSYYSEEMEVRMYKSGYFLASAWADGVSAAYNQASNTVIVECYPGDYVWIEAAFSGTLYGYDYTTFGGVELSRFK